MKLKQIIIILFMTASVMSCSNEDNTFHLNTVKLIEYSQRESISEQRIFIKAFSNDSPEPLAQTEKFSNALPMPITLKMHPKAEMNLYGKDYHLELWGEVSGFIGRCDIDMDNYKIVFPIDMEIEGEELTASIQGGWD